MVLDQSSVGVDNFVVPDHTSVGVGNLALSVFAFSFSIFVCYVKLIQLFICFLHAKKKRLLVEAQPEPLGEGGIVTNHNMLGILLHLVFKKKGKIKWLSCYGAYGGGGMTRYGKTRMSQEILEAEKVICEGNQH